MSVSLPGHNATGFKTWFVVRAEAAVFPSEKRRSSRERSRFPRWDDGGAHLVGPAPTAGTAPAAPAPSAPSAAAPGAAQVSKVDLQLGCDVVGGLAEVVIHYRVLSVGLPGEILHQRENGTKIPSWAPGAVLWLPQHTLPSSDCPWPGETRET